MDDSLRASDSEREDVVRRLGEAHVEGRLSLDDLDRRVAAANAAGTVGELRALMVDLPGAPAPTAVALADVERPYTAGQIAGAVALTVFAPFGRLIGLVYALSLLRDERLPERRRHLITWAIVCAVVLVIEVAVVLLLVVP